MGKLSFDDKLDIYKDRKNGMTIQEIENKYNVTANVIKYLIRLIDKHLFLLLKVFIIIIIICFSTFSTFLDKININKYFQKKDY